MSRFLFLVLFFSGSVCAEDIVLSDDGREVQINRDGTWEFISNDRFATTREGDRIRLKPDGSWERVEDDRNWVTIPAAGLNRDQVIEGSVQLEIAEVIIESVRSRQQKNTRLRSQIVTWLTVTSTEPQSFTIDPSDLILRDSRGKQYDTVSVMPGNIEVFPDAPVKVRVIANDSPSWWGVKYFTYEVVAGVLGNKQSLKLTRSMNGVAKRETEALTK